MEHSVPTLGSLLMCHVTSEVFVHSDASGSELFHFNTAVKVQIHLHAVCNNAIYMQVHAISFQIVIVKYFMVFRLKVPCVQQDDAFR